MELLISKKSNLNFRVLISFLRRQSIFFGVIFGFHLVSLWKVCLLKAGLFVGLGVSSSIHSELDN